MTRGILITRKSLNFIMKNAFNFAFGNFLREFYNGNYYSGIRTGSMSLHTFVFNFIRSQLHNLMCK